MNIQEMDSFLNDTLPVLQVWYAETFFYIEVLIGIKTDTEVISCTIRLENFRVSACDVDGGFIEQANILTSPCGVVFLTNLKQPVGTWLDFVRGGSRFYGLQLCQSGRAIVIRHQIDFNRAIIVS